MSESREAPTQSTQSSTTEPEKVDINAYGVPVSKNAGKLGSRIGKLVRMHVPISYESWDKVPPKIKNDVWVELLKRFDLDPDTKDFYFKRMCESFRRHKTELRTKYYDKFSNYDERLKNCPPTVSQDDWEGFLKNEEKPGVSERREIGKKNRKGYNYGHHTGRTSHAVVEHDMAIANPDKEITRLEVWETVHTKKDGSITDSTSPYFDKIKKAKEAMKDGVEEELPLDEDILSQVFGKDTRGRTRSIGTKISRTQVKASKIARKQIKTTQNMEDRMTNVEGTLKTLVELIKGNYEKQIPDNASNEGGSNACHDATETQPEIDIGNRQNSSESVSLKCEILNFNLEVIATGTVCRGSLGSIIHGKAVPPSFEKLVVDSILLPDESTTKQNHALATTFGEVGVGGFVCHPKNLLRYL